ncbi:Palmitoyl-monogalactosyldiacylglycerol delta-7 desaturase, chloroplastic [Linum grandiflorum]
MRAEEELMIISDGREMRKWSKWEKIAIVNMVVTHLMAFCGLFWYFSWSAFWVWFPLTNFIGLLGINLSYHRQLTHKSFKTPKWLEYSFAYCGVHALQGDPLTWVSNHRYHHQYSDTEKDPHSPIKGFWYSHMSWIFESSSIREKCGKRDNVGDLEKQAFYKWIRRTYFIHPLSLALILYAFGGFSCLLWGMVGSNIGTR